MKRAISLVLSLIIALSPVCTAFADFSVPAALTVIESEAFRDMPISGSVALPDGVKHIGDRAFANTDVFSMDMPAGLETIGDGILSGTDAVYVDIPGAQTRLTGSALGAEVIIGRGGSNAHEWADAHGVPFLADARIYEQDGFVYAYVTAEEAAEDGFSSEGFYLVFAKNNNISGSVTIPDEVDGLPVLLVGELAFSRLDGVTEINLPESAAVALEGNRKNWPNAQINTYETASLNVFVVEGVEAFSMPLGAFAIPAWGYDVSHEDELVLSITCSDPEVLDLYVNETGTWFSAKSLKEGTATITIHGQVRDVSDTETITITVTEEAPVPDLENATELAGNYAEMAVVPGDTFRLIIEEEVPKSDTWYNQHWMSSNPDVVVNEGGDFLAVAAGEADIYSIMTLASGEVFYAKAHIIVEETESLDIWVAADAFSMPLGAIAIPQWHLVGPEHVIDNAHRWIDCDNPDVLDLFVNESGDWFSAASLNEGEATLTLHAEYGELYAEKTITITVGPEAEIPDLVNATELRGNYSELTLTPGDMFALIVEEEIPPIETWYNHQWMSDNEDVVVTDGPDFRVVGFGEANVYSIMTLADGQVFYAKAHVTSIEPDVPEDAIEIPLSHDWLRVNPGDRLGLWTDEQLPDGNFHSYILSSNEDVAIWHEGEEEGVEFVGTGSAILTLVFQYESGECFYGRCRVFSVDPTLDVFFHTDYIRIPVGATIHVPWDWYVSSDLFFMEELGALDHFASEDGIIEAEEDQWGAPYKITGMKPGVVEYTIEGEVRGAYDSETVTVEVYEPEIVLNTYNVFGYTGFKYPLIIESEIPDNAHVAFYSSDENVATVDEDGVVTLHDPNPEAKYETFEADITCVVSYEENGEQVELSQVCRFESVEWNFGFRDVDMLEVGAHEEEPFIWPMLGTSYWREHAGNYKLESISHNPEILTFGEATETIDAVPQAVIHGVGLAEVTFKASFIPAEGTPLEGTPTYVEMTIPVMVHEPWLEAYLHEGNFELYGIGDYRHISFHCEGEVEPLRQYLTSSDPSIASVTPDGVVRAEGAGTATITYTVEWKYGVKHSQSIEVTVHGNKVTLNATEITLKKGESFTLVPFMDVPEGFHVDTHFWSTNESVAYAYWNGLVTGIAEGTAAVMFSGQIGDYEAQAVCIVHVVDEDAKITLSETYKELRQGESFTLIPSFPENAEVTDITFTSDDEGTVIVDQNGVVTMIGDTQHITHYPNIEVSAVVDGVKVSAYCTVRSYATPVVFGGIHSSIVTEIGDEFKLWYEVLTNGSDTPYTVTFVSGDEDVLKVTADGMVTAVGKGETSLTVTIISEDDASVIYDQEILPVYIGMLPKVVEEIRFDRDHYFVERHNGRSTGLMMVPEEAWKYWGDIYYESENWDIVEIYDGGDIHGVNEGTTTITATARYLALEDGEVVEKTATASAKVTVAELRLVSDKDVYEPGEIATLTIEGLPEDIDYEWIEWSFPNGVNECTPVMHEQNMNNSPTIQVRVNQPGEYWFNVRVNIDYEFQYYFEHVIFCDGNWNDHILNRNDVHMAVGDSTWVGPQDNTFEAIRTESTNTDVVTIAEDDIFMLTAVGEGTAEVNYYFMRWDDEAQMEVEDVRTAYITVEEPVWGVYDWDNVPSVMQVGREYWCGVSYWYNGIDFEQHETLTLSDENAAHIHSENHMTVVAHAPGSFTLTVNVEIGGKTYTESKEILVVEPAVYPQWDVVELNPMDTYEPNLITSGGAQIESVKWASSDESKASVDPDSGFVTVVGAFGRAVITAEVTLVGGETLQVSYIVEIVHHELEGCEVNNPYITMNLGEWIDVWFTEELPHCDGWQEWKWEVSEDGVLVMHDDGRFEAIGYGTVNVQLLVTYEDGRRFYGVSRVHVVPSSLDIFFYDESAKIPVGATYFPNWDFETSTDLFDQGFDFYTDNEDVLKVEHDAMQHAVWITGLKPGKATLYIHGTYLGGVEDTASIEVEVYQPDVALNTYDIWGYTGFQYQLSLEEELNEGAEVRFTSSDEWLASVDENGLVTVHPHGGSGDEYDVVITCEVIEADGSSRTAECQMKIVDWYFEFSDVQELGIRVGETGYLWPRVRTSWWKQHTECFRFESVSSNEDVLSFTEPTYTMDAVPDATAHSLGDGWVEVTFYASFNPPDAIPMEGTETSIERTMMVQIYEPYLEPNIDEGYIEIGSVGDSHHLNFWCDRDCDLDAQYLYSSDPSVVTIDAEGEMRAVGVGHATVTYAVEACGIRREVSAEVYVRGYGVTLNETEITIGVGESFCLVPTSNVPDDRQMRDNFHVASDEIAYIDDSGMVTGLAAGRTIVTYQCEVQDWNEYGEFWYYERVQCTVNVVDPQAQMTLSENYKELRIGESFTLTASFPEGAEVTDLTFTSNDEAHVTVDQNGVVTLIQGTGGYDHYPSVCVSAKVNGEVVSAYCTVRGVEKLITFRDLPGHISMHEGQSDCNVDYGVTSTDPALEYKVTFSSENEAVVTVDPESSELTAVGAGATEVIMRIESADGFVYDEYVLPVYVDTAIPVPNGIEFEHEVYYRYIPSQDERFWLNASLISDSEYEMWRFYNDGQIKYELVSGEGVIELDGRWVNTLSEGEAEIKATYTFTDEAGETQQVHSTAKVIVFKPEVVSDKEAYEIGEIATLTVTGISESAEVNSVYWEYPRGSNALSLVEEDGLTLKVLVNQIVGDGDHWVNMYLTMEGGIHIERSCPIHAIGDWNNYTLSESYAITVPGETFFIHPEFPTNGFRAYSDDENVVTCAPDDPSRLTAQGLGEATVTFVCNVWEEDQEIEITRTAIIKVVEPEWELQDGWYNVPAVMQVGYEYWCGPNYDFNGWHGIEQYAALTSDNEDVLQIKEDDHLRVLAVGEGTATLTLTVDYAGKHREVSKQVLVVRMPVRPENTYMEVRPGLEYSMNLIVDEGLEIVAQQWSISEDIAELDRDTGVFVPYDTDGYATLTGIITLSDGRTVAVAYDIRIVQNHEIWREWDSYHDWIELSTAEHGNHDTTVTLGVGFRTNADPREIQVEWFADDDTLFYADDVTSDNIYDHFERTLHAVNPGETVYHCHVWVDGAFDEWFDFHVSVYEPVISITPEQDVYILEANTEPIQINWNDDFQHCQNPESEVIMTSDEYVAIVEVNGNIRPSHVGETTVTRRVFFEGGHTVEASVRVIVNGVSMTINEEVLTLAVGETHQLVYTYENTYGDLEVYEPILRTTDENVGYVDEDGVVHAVGVGTAVIAFGVQTNYGERMGELVLTVTDENEPAFAISASHTEENAEFVGQNVDKFYGFMDYQFSHDFEGQIDDVQWRVETLNGDEQVWMDENGLLTIGEVGWLQYCSVVCEITSGGEVYKATFPIQLNMANIRISNWNMDGESGAWRYLNVGHEDHIDEAIIFTDPDVAVMHEWYSEDESVITVDHDGNVYAVGEGETNVKLVVWTSDGEVQISSARVFVYPVKIVISVHGRYAEEITLHVGEGVYINSDECGVNSFVKSEAFYSSDESVVDVDVHGNVSARSVGEATITRRIFTENGTYSAELLVRVVGTSVTCGEEEINLQVGDRYWLDLQVNSTYEDLVEDSCFFSTSDASVASVDENGTVYAIGAGSAVIHYRLFTNHDVAYGDLVVNVAENEQPKLTISAAHTPENAAVLEDYDAPDKFFAQMPYQFSYDFDGSVDSVSWSVWTDYAPIRINDAGLMTSDNFDKVQPCIVICEVTSGDKVYSASYAIQMNPANIRITNWNMGSEPGAWRYHDVGNEEFINERIVFNNPNVAVQHLWESDDPNVIQMLDNDGSYKAVGKGQTDVTLTAWTSEGEVIRSYIHFCVEERNAATSMTTWTDTILWNRDWGRVRDPLMVEPLYSTFEIEYAYDPDMLWVDNEHWFYPMQNGRTTVTAHETQAGLSASWDYVFFDGSLQLREPEYRTVFKPGEKIQLVFEGDGYTLDLADAAWVRFENPEGNPHFDIDENGLLTIFDSEEWRDCWLRAVVGCIDGMEWHCEFHFFIEPSEFFYLSLNNTQDRTPVLYPGYNGNVHIRSDFEVLHETLLCVSDNEAVATVDSDGVLHCHSAGTATLTTTAETVDGVQLRDEMTITVVEAEDPQITCEMERNVLRFGDTIRVWIGCNDPYSVVPEYSFISGDEEVLRYDGHQDEYGSQTVTAVKHGTTTLTAVAHYGDHEVRDTMTVYVIAD